MDAFTFAIACFACLCLGYALAWNAAERHFEKRLERRREIEIGSYAPIEHDPAEIVEVR